MDGQGTVQDIFVHEHSWGQGVSEKKLNATKAMGQPDIPH